MDHIVATVTGITGTIARWRLELAVAAVAVIAHSTRSPVVGTFDRARLAGALDADVAPHPAGRTRHHAPCDRTDSPSTLAR